MSHRFKRLATRRKRNTLRNTSPRAPRHPYKLAALLPPFNMYTRNRATHPNYARNYAVTDLLATVCIGAACQANGASVQSVRNRN